MSYKRNRTRRRDFDYTWRKPISASGKQTVYLKILLYLKAHGPSTKREILGTIKHMNTNFETWRGYCSKTFSCMHFDHLIEYNPHTYRWSIGEFGQKLIDIAAEEILPNIQTDIYGDDYVDLVGIETCLDTELETEPMKDLYDFWGWSGFDKINADVDEFISDIDTFIGKLQSFKQQLNKLR